MARSSASRARRRWRRARHRRGHIVTIVSRQEEEEALLKGAIPPVSRRRDAVPDDARSRPRSPNAPGRLSTPERWALGNRSGPGMTLAAAAPTTDRSESLATDIFGIAGPSHALDPEDEGDRHRPVGKWPATARLQTVAAAGHLPTGYRRKLSLHIAPGRTTGMKPAASCCDVARRPSAKIPLLTNAPLPKVGKGFFRVSCNGSQPTPARSSTMNGLNRVDLIGNLGADPEFRSLPGGGDVASFSIATNDGYRDARTGEYRQLTEWHRSAVKTKKERKKHELTQRLGHADDRPVAETPPRPAKGAGRKGVAKFRRFPAVGRESCDPTCTGCEPSLAGRATTGPMASDMRSTCRKPLYLLRSPRWPDGAEGTRTEPDGVGAAFWRVRQAHSDTGQPFYPVSPSRKGYSVPPKGLRFVIGTREPMPSARYGTGLAAENGDGLHGGGALVVVGARESRAHGEGGQKVERLS